MVLKFGRSIHSVHWNKSPLKIMEKGERRRIQGMTNFLGAPIITGTGKATDFKFGSHIQMLHPNKSPLKRKLVLSQR